MCEKKSHSQSALCLLVEGNLVTFSSKMSKKQVVADPHLLYKLNGEKFWWGFLDKSISFSGESL